MTQRNISMSKMKRRHTFNDKIGLPFVLNAALFDDLGQMHHSVSELSG